MTNRFTLSPPDGIDRIIVNREEIEGEISLTIDTEDVAIKINLGRTNEQAHQLLALLDNATKAAQEMVDDWEDKPDDYDGYVSMNDGSYYVQLGLKDHGTYPTKKIAIIELAQAMIDTGHFPNSWYQYDAYTVPLDDEVRACHDEAGDQMRPLGGIYERNDEIEVNHTYQTGPNTWDSEWTEAYVIKDYGDAGVLYDFYGLNEGPYVADHESVRRAPEEAE